MFVYDLSGLVAQIDVENVSREIWVTVFTPGRTFNFICGAWASNAKEANDLYAQWLPTFRSIFSTIAIEPRR